MSAEISFLVALLSKMAVAAACVVTASLVAERLGPVLGALVATLPVSAGPAYVFLALDNDSAFVAASALSSVPANAATIFAAFAYILAAQRLGLLASFAIMVAVWAALAVFVRSQTWTLGAGVAANVLAFGLCIPLSRRFRVAPMGTVRRRWYDIPLRATLVACLVATVVLLGRRFGPAISGILALYPVVFTSLILILHPRIGGPATAAVVANSFWGMVGFGLAVVMLQVTAAPLGSAAALLLALGVALGWNALALLRYRRLRAA